jgi:hypothetical protein
MKIRILRGTTIAEQPVFEPGTGDPPTFAHGDIVEVDRALAQQLVGSGKAEFYSGEPLNEPAPYETAALEPSENALKPLRRMNKAELLAEAVARGVEVEEDASNAVIREALEN